MPLYSAVAHAALVLLALARGATAITIRVGFMGKSKSANDGQRSRPILRNNLKFPPFRDSRVRVIKCAMCSSRSHHLYTQRMRYGLRPPEQPPFLVPDRASTPESWLLNFRFRPSLSIIAKAHTTTPQVWHRRPPRALRHSPPPSKRSILGPPSCLAATQLKGVS